ncbi:O-antigen ligase family protein [Vaginella massiliensis]|uniref:O-antigen ligase family protein n=1 Tax=Vaginella massiliensis TaxID=1816680 RepID=UPI000838D2FC|nr:O-antigen ligase family protein [Vaginella massiliensis]
MTKIQLLTISIAALLLTLPLPFAFNSVALVLLIVAVVLNYKDLKFKFNWTYFLLLALFFWSCLSVFWSYAPEISTKAIGKILPMFIIPVIFSFIPMFNQKQRDSIFTLYAYGITAYMAVMLGFAFYNFLVTGSTHWFFYHDLVSLKVNAIYVSVFVAMAFIFLVIRSEKRPQDWACLVILFVSLILLSSKNMVIVTFFVIGIYGLMNLRKLTNRKIIASLFVGALLLVSSGGYVYNRFQNELRDVKENEIIENGIENISLYNAWHQAEFNRNSYFNGSSFRIYQLRLLFELQKEYPIFWKGFGLNAAQDFLTQKQKKQDLDEYYWDLNFHNQYAQTTAELGVLGLIILCLMVANSFYVAIRNRDFYALAFSILMASFFVTESPLSRQRGIVFIMVFCCLLSQLNSTKLHSHPL